MSFVHMRRDFRLGLDQGLGASHRNEQILGRQIDDAPETADEMSAFDLQPPERKIWKIDIKRGLRLAREKPALAVPSTKIAARGSAARLRV
jgi:hypothetical protein